MTTMTDSAVQSAAPAQDNDVLLEINNLKMYFPVTSGMLFQRTVAYVKAVDDVSFTVRRGETLGLVGESGCGEDDHGPLHSAVVQADRRRGEVRWTGPHQIGDEADAGHAPRDAGDLPRSLQLTEPPHDSWQYHRRAANCSRPREWKERVPGASRRPAAERGVEPLHG